MKITGIILIVVGAAVLLWGGFSYTTRRNVVDVGPVHASVDQRHNVALPPLGGAAALIAGILLVVAGRKTNS